MCSIDSGLWCWDATTQAASDDAPSQRWGWRGVLSFSFEVRVRQGRILYPVNPYGESVRLTQTYFVLVRLLFLLKVTLWRMNFH